MDTLDSLLESIAFENFTTNIHVAGLLNGNNNNNNNSNNNEINRKTDALNRYFDNLINFNREYEKFHSRKSDSPSDQSSELSDQQFNNVRRPSQVKFICNNFHSLKYFIHSLLCHFISSLKKTFKTLGFEPLFFLLDLCDFCLLILMARVRVIARFFFIAKMNFSLNFNIFLI